MKSTFEEHNRTIHESHDSKQEFQDSRIQVKYRQEQPHRITAVSIAVSGILHRVKC